MKESMRGITCAYNKVISRSADYYSDLNKFKRAKNKLLGLDIDRGHYVEYLDNTCQTCLICSCYDSDVDFGLCISTILEDKISSETILGKTYNDLLSFLDSHRVLCMENVAQRYGKLCIGFYSCRGRKYLTGVVDDEIVFIFRLGDYKEVCLLELKLVGYKLIFKFSTYKTRCSICTIDVSDYSILDVRRIEDV